MARVRDEEAVAVRRDVFVVAASRLIREVGYEAMSIQDVLTAVGASKGAFYYYFDSKTALLQAVIEQAAQRVKVVLDDEVRGGGPEGLRALYRALGVAKEAQAGLLRSLAAVWYSDENAVVRHRTRVAISEHVTPRLTQIITDGTAHLTFTVADPEQTARLLTEMIHDLNDHYGRMMINNHQGRAFSELAVRVADAHEQAVSRILAVDEPLRLIDRDVLHRWAGTQSGGHR